MGNIFSCSRAKNRTKRGSKKDRPLSKETAKSSSSECTDSSEEYDSDDWDDLASTEFHSAGKRPDPKELSVSAQWKEKGNAFYRDATEDLSPTIRISRLQEAINLYGHALSTAADDDERALACKNIAMANWKIAEAKMVGCTSGSSITSSFRDAMKHFQDANEYGKGRDLTWINKLTVAALSCWTDARKRMDEWPFEERIRELQKLVGYVIGDSTKARGYLEIASQYLHWAVTVLDERDCQRSLRLLAEVNIPLNEARRLGRADSNLQRECEMVEEDIHIQRYLAESIQAQVRKGERLNYALNLDMVWKVVDWLRREAQLTKDRGTELAAMVLCCLDKIYNKVLKMTDCAKTCLMKALELANTMFPSLFSTDKWYQFAHSIWAKHQQEKQKVADEERKMTREEILNLIKEEVDILHARHKVLGKLEFLKFIYTTHPPKNPQHKLREVSANPDWTELKKHYQKAVIHYHPDKVQEDEHGAKWKVLTEEITKLLTSHYEFYKGCD